MNCSLQKFENNPKKNYFTNNLKKPTKIFENKLFYITRNESFSPTKITKFLILLLSFNTHHFSFNFLFILSHTPTRIFTRYSINLSILSIRSPLFGNNLRIRIVVSP